VNMLQTINHKIRRGFSASAKQYDLFTGLHREIADKLLAQVTKGPKPSALLDVGCGTGYLTVKAKDHFPQSKIIGLDFAQDMLNMARRKHGCIAWVLGDGNELPFSDGSFDTLVSNLAYQWSGDLSHAFSEARRVLSTDGVLACTLFGYNTCRELFQSLEEAKQGALQFTRLPDGSQVREALIISGFKDPKIDGEQIKIEFNGMYELMTWLKLIGANHLPREGHVGKEALGRAAAIYRERFACHNGVAATFEVIRVYVKK
jgi:malonyl-CoA O-methyltransferase